MGYIRDHFGEILGVVALIAGIYFYVKSRRSIRASYYIRTDRLIGPMGSVFEGLEIVYQGVSIHSFASSKVFLWNQGTEVIRRDDIAPAAPLAINLHAPERALNYEVVYCSSPYSKVGIEPQGDERLLVSFDFLNPGDGCVLEILHRGDIGSLSMSGGIIGGGDIRQTNPLTKDEAQQVTFGIFALVILPLYLLAIVLPLRFGSPGFPPSINLGIFAALALSIVVLHMVIWKLVLRWSGGATFKKLCDGYAKQERPSQKRAAWRVAAFWFAVVIVTVVGFMLGVFSG